METLDNNIKYYNLFLTKDNLNDIKEIPLSDGYHFDFYNDGDYKHWIEIGTQDGEFTSYEDGLNAWNTYYTGHEEELKNRLIFLKKDNDYIGTATAYYDVLGKDDPSIGRLHWVGIKKKYQGLGLSKPLISYALNILKKLGYTKIKISTQTNSWLACKIYLDFGFIPTDDNEDGWNIVKTITNHSKLEKYKIVNNIYKNNKK